MEYRIGLDIGIGSVGWAVVSAEQDGHPARIEDFGTRIFQSGEDEKTRESLCQGRRSARGVRRLERRRSYRKKILKNHFANIGILNETFNDEYAACKDADVYELKVKGLDEQLSPAELYKCLVHTCNHRGYRDFYEPEEDDEEAGLNESAANELEEAFIKSGKRTVSEYLLADKLVNGFVKYRNRNEGDNPYRLIRRKLLLDEVRQILTKQSEYYSCLTQKNIDRTETIIFNQRDFEDGPGNPDDPNRRYCGFLEKLGKCPYYKEEDRGFRGTVIADVFAVTNTLSQYRFVDKSTGEYTLDKAVAKEIVDRLLTDAKMNLTEIKKILKAHGFELRKSENSDDKALNKAIKYLALAKKCVEAAGYNWAELITEEQFDVENPSLLHRIGELISTYQTPSRRKKEMKAAGVDTALIDAFSSKKLSGTASVSYRYMCDAIHAFMDGDIYGNYQARFIKEQQTVAPTEKCFKLKPGHIDDADIRNNRVVFKAVNETRKIVNAIIDTYGSPTAIVIEVASELGKSKDMRDEITRAKNANEKATAKVKEAIAELLHEDVDKVTPVMVERYKLYVEQDGQCAYSGKPLGELSDVVRNTGHAYEIDHIVPYSLILDNTLHNKALVLTEENQKKGQQTPLMYMTEEQGKAFRARVKAMLSRKENPLSRKKAEYCLLETVYGAKAEDILSGWKSRNINDTRYITKYIAGIIDRYLLFAGDAEKQHVFTVKGAVTQKFRREWFKDSPWGDAEKNRENYLNHALDALVAANLTKAYIEIGSDALRLIALYRRYRSTSAPEYVEYLEKCVRKMEKYYGFPEAKTRMLLKNTERAPAYLPRLADEVKVRFNDEDENAFDEGVKKLYGNEAPFIVPPHIPVTSHKQDKKFKGCIADDNPIRVVEIDGAPHKIRRINVRAVSVKTLPKLRCGDPSLVAQLTEILEGKTEKYTIDSYLKETNQPHFISKGGVVIRKVSIDDGPVTNFYRKTINENNYTNLSKLKYYCVELYRDKNGNLKNTGIRFVDIINKDKKLYRKANSLPQDYAAHEMYLFAGDYIRIINSKGELKFDGFYTAVFNINQNQFYCKHNNNSSTCVKPISPKDKVIKYSIDILGRIGGTIKCSEPLPCIAEKKSR